MTELEYESGRDVIGFYKANMIANYCSTHAIKLPLTFAFYEFSSLMVPVHYNLLNENTQ